MGRFDVSWVGCAGPPRNEMEGMTGEFEHRNLSMLLLQSREAVMGLFRPILKEYALTEQQWRVIRALNEHDAGTMEIGQIARECCILSPSLSGMLERMAQAGLVTRLRSSTDQRKVMVSLTDESRSLMRRLSPRVDAQYRLLEARIGASTLDEVYRLLDKIIASAPCTESDDAAPTQEARVGE